MQNYKDIFTHDMIKYFDGSCLRHQIKIKPKAYQVLKGIDYLEYLQNERSYFQKKPTKDFLKLIKNIENNLYITKNVNYGLGIRKTAIHFKLYMSLVEPRINKFNLNDEDFINNKDLKKEFELIKLELEQLNTIDEKIEALKNYCISTQIHPKKLIHLFITPTKNKSDEERLSIKLFNAKTSRRNAKFKLMLNFGESLEYSFLTLTLSNKNQQGELINDFQKLHTVKKLSSQYITILRNIRREQLKNEFQQELQGLTKREQNRKLSSLLKVHFKHFRSYEQTQKGQWHVHFIFNCDLVKVFGYDTKYYFCSSDSEFYINKNYYQENKNADRYKYTQWFKKDNSVIANVCKYWNEVVMTYHPNLKPLNPRSQNLQTFKKIDDKNTLQTFYTRFKKITRINNKNPIVIFISYLTKYVSKMEDMDESFTDAKNKRERLFLFSRGCVAPKVERFLSLQPYDLHEDNHLINFCSEIDFLNDDEIQKDHYLKLLCQSTFNPDEFFSTDKEIKGYKNCITFKNDGTKIYHCQESKYYIFHYLKILDLKDFLKDNFLKNNFFIKQVQNLKKIFNLDKLRVKKPNCNFFMNYIRFHNYLTPIE